jgi:acetyltransferase-like isoleucine patch superfamily enzyme
MNVRGIVIHGSAEVDPSSSINNIEIGERVRIAKRCSLFGGPSNPLRIGRDSYVGMNCTINGYRAEVLIGSNVSIAQGCNIMADSGPNASAEMQKYFPIIVAKVVIGDHSWIGANAVIMPGVELGAFCVVAANSFVNSSFEAYSVIGGTPAKLLYRLGKEAPDRR